MDSHFVVHQLVLDLLLRINPRFNKYVLRFYAADIGIDQLPRLTKEDYLYIGVSLGDALILLDYFQGTEMKYNDSSGRLSPVPSKSRTCVESMASSVATACIGATSTVTSAVIPFGSKKRDAIDEDDE